MENYNTSMLSNSTLVKLSTSQHDEDVSIEYEIKNSIGSVSGDAKYDKTKSYFYLMSAKDLKLSSIQAVHFLNSVGLLNASSINLYSMYHIINDDSFSAYGYDSDEVRLTRKEK
jgi:hypothetical protein